MPVLAIKTEPRCKLCTHSHRGEIDLLLEKRSKGEKDEHGRRFNEEYVLEIFQEWGVQNPTPDNIRNHWKKHCEMVTAAEQKIAEQGMTELNEEMIAILDESDGTIDGDLKAIFQLGMKRIRGKIMRGEDPGVSLDHQLKASAELTKRAHNESTRELLGQLGAGLAQGLMQAREPRQIEGAEIIDVEPTEEST